MQYARSSESRASRDTAQRRTTTNFTPFSPLGGTGKAETVRLGQPEARVRRSLPAASILVVAGRPAVTAQSTVPAKWVHVGRGAAALGAAMGIGRFAYTPDPAADDGAGGLTPQAAGHLATANYVGYLAGAVAGTVSTRLTHRRPPGAHRWSSSLRRWLDAVREQRRRMDRAQDGRGVHQRCGVRHRGQLDAGSLAGHSPHLPGWGFGGVGVGIALSGARCWRCPRPPAGRRRGGRRRYRPRC